MFFFFRHISYREKGRGLEKVYLVLNPPQHFRVQGTEWSNLFAGRSLSKLDAIGDVIAGGVTK